MPLLQSAVGPGAYADGANPNFRSDRTGAMVSIQAGGYFQEAALRGQVFSAVTPAAGVAIAAGTATAAIGTTGMMALANATGSGKLLVVLFVSAGYVSGTLGAGVVDVIVHGTGTIVGTAITAKNMRTDLTTSPTGLATNAATVPASGVPLIHLFSTTALLASSAVTPYSLVIPLHGALIVGPGSSISFQATAAGGSSPLITLGVIWQEIST